MLAMSPTPVTHRRAPAPDGVIERVSATVGAALGSVRRPVVLAVSGGLDSMVLLDAAARGCRASLAAVATFDHGSGPSATAAARLVTEVCVRQSIPCVIGRAEAGLSTESEWREARWRFLRAVAAEHAAVVATAHTRDDQLETVLIRILRGAGARGIAGLFAESDVLRPLLEVERAEVAAYAAARGLAFSEDPTNRSRRHLRNRVRLDILPALRRVRPTLDEELLDLARRAATLRQSLETTTAALGRIAPDGDELSVAATDLEGYSRESLGVLWPALAARLGAVLDWRGTRRLTEFTITGVVGATIPLSGGWEVARLRERFVLRRARRGAAPRESQLLVGDMSHDAWRFRPTTEMPTTLWEAALPASRRLTVRSWQPGDRIALRSGGTRRRVKRFFGDAGIAGPERGGWPVVLADDEIVWIPGVCRSDDASGQSGEPAVIYICERVHR